MSKVKPFYIRITEDMTPQMVQDAFDKCVDAGVNAFDGILGCDMKHSYDEVYELNFVCFGVDFDGDTYLSDEHERYGKDAQEITLDKLDEWLGLETEQGWKNGDECMYNNEVCYFVGVQPVVGSNVIGDCVIQHNGGAPLFVLLSELSKPESPEQKAERERLEAAYDLYTHVQSVRGQLSCRFDLFSNSEMEETRLRFLAVVDKTNYRKQ